MKSYEQTKRELKLLGYHNVEMMAFERVSNNLRNVKQRLYERVYEIQKENGYFVTLTYKGLEPSEHEVYNHMKTWCRKNCDLYLGNIDYGEKKERIHIHVACVPNKTLNKTWKYGAINIIKIKKGKSDGRKVSNYITKIVNHAVKKTTSRIIRSKKIRKEDSDCVDSSIRK
jgi:hypothetical protein